MPRVRRAATIAVLVLVAMVGGCAQRGWVRSELYFGLSAGPAAHAMDVTDADWATFVDAEVTPRFPDGLTVLDGAGQWRASANSPVVRERSKVLVILRPNTPDADRKLQEIRAAYRARFGQAEVLRVDQPARLTP